MFDNACFGVSSAEAGIMDPQQRMVLEHSLSAAHGAGVTKAQLMGSSTTAVYVGIWQCEYADVVSNSSAALSVFAATAAACSVVAGRVSFTLGMQGPCASIDTACSSALVASHSSMRALQLSECALGLALGVNMIFSPSAGAANAFAGMTSPTGKSHTFDRRANGYARCEACGAVALKCDDGSAELVYGGSA
eukprot:5364432-Prymnesium_polylepis.2